MSPEPEPFISRYKHWLALSGLILLALLAWAAGLHDTLTLAGFQTYKDALLTYTQDHAVIAAAAYIVIYAASVALSLPAATLMTLAGGFLFGKWWGTLYVVTAATIGATLIFLIARSTFGAALRAKAGTVYTKIAVHLDENAAGYLLFMRLVPLFPFVLVNIVPALVPVKLRVFVLTTFFGIIPGSFVYTNLGAELGEVESLTGLVSTDTLLAFTLLGLFALIPVIYKTVKARYERS